MFPQPDKFIPDDENLVKAEGIRLTIKEPSLFTIYDYVDGEHKAVWQTDTAEFVDMLNLLRKMLWLARKLRIIRKDDL